MFVRPAVSPWVLTAKLTAQKVGTTTTNTSYGTTRDGTIAAQSALIASNVQIGADDEVYCLVEIPEQYQTITRQALKTPAAVREVEIPALFAEVPRQLLDKAAGSRSVDIPGFFQTVTRQEIDVNKMRTGGYKFDNKGDLVAMPEGIAFFAQPPLTAGRVRCLRALQARARLRPVALPRCRSRCFSRNREKYCGRSVRY